MSGGPGRAGLEPDQGRTQLSVCSARRPGCTRVGAAVKVTVAFPMEGSPDLGSPATPVAARGSWEPLEGQGSFQPRYPLGHTALEAPLDCPRWGGGRDVTPLFLPPVISLGEARPTHEQTLGLLMDALVASKWPAILPRQQVRSTGTSTQDRRQDRRTWDRGSSH